MHFPSLSILTTLACAVFSVAAPLGVSDLIDATNKLGTANTNVARDVPATPVAPLVATLQELYVALVPACDAVVNAVNGKVSAEVDTKEIKSSILNVVAVVASFTGKIQKSATESVENVQAQVVAKLLYQIIAVVYTALATVAKVQVLVGGVLGPIVAEITTQLVAIVVTVTTVVPGVVALVVEELKPLYNTIVSLNAAAILGVLGVESPFA